MKSIESLVKEHRANQLEKASKVTAHNIGEVHPTNPDWLWTDIGNGKGDWKSKNGSWWKGKNGNAANAGTSGGSKSTASEKTVESKSGEFSAKVAESLSPDDLVEYAKKASTSALAKVVNDVKADKQLRQFALNELKTRDDYDKTKVNSADLKGGHVAKPTPKIQYKTKKPEVEVDSDTFEDYEIPTPQGRKKVVISTFRNFLKTKSDADLLTLLNNTAQKADAIKRHLAYEEAAARGIPEDKIVTKGSLERLWKKYKTEHDLKNYSGDNYKEDEALKLNYDFKGLDHEKIMNDEFDGGEDSSWLDEKSKAVQRIFNLDTLSGRQKYDAFKDYYQRDKSINPGYLTAQQKCDELNGMMWDWAQNPDSPLFISAGGAGAGKTYGWREIVADDLSLPELKPGDDPTNKDWGWIMLTDEQAEDEKEFAKTLEKYNGTFTGTDGREYPHILFFDDADRLLTTGKKALVGMMKKINDPDPDNRVFTDSNGKQQLWRGKILITTNKDIAKLNENEDTKAVLSRAEKSEIKFTRNEALELLYDRYQKMPLKRANSLLRANNYTKEEEAELRQDVFDFLQDNIGKADPRKFQPRVFEDIVLKVAGKWKNGSKARKTGKGNIGTSVPWQISVLELIKGGNSNFEKAEDMDEMYTKENLLARKKRLEEIKKRAKKAGKFEKLFGDEARDAIIFGSSNKEKKKEKKAETKKAYDNEMSLDEAEEILFG